MPHIMVEFSSTIAEDIATAGVLAKVHHTVVDSGLFTPDAIKTRPIAYDTVIWGTGGIHVDFVHVTVKILDGRTEAQRKQLSDDVFEVLNELLPNVAKRSVDIHEMAKATYNKN